AEEGVEARVVDLYSIKPLDDETLRVSVEATGGRLVTVEDYWPEGGLGEAGVTALAVGGEALPPLHLPVSDMPPSRQPARLMHAYGIDADAITAAARRLVGARVAT